MKYRLKHILEYAVLRVIAGLMCALPYRAALALGWIIARMAFYLFRSRVANTRKRIRDVFGPDHFSARETDAVAWLSWRNVIFNAVEIMRVGKINRTWLERVIDSDRDLLEMKVYADRGRGGIIACPHMGNWELAEIACHVYGIPIFSIAGKQKNPLTDRFLNDLRSKPGIANVERGGGTMREVIRRLRDGQFVAILLDVRARSGGLTLPFLGGEANVGTGMALFARHTGVPIFPCICTRIGWGRHRLVAGDPIWSDPSLTKQDDVRRMTEAVLKSIDERIRIDPGQWFWFNKRWVLDPVE